MMTLIESIRTCFIRYIDFDGRSSRSEFWYFMLFLIVAWYPLHFISHLLSGLFTLATLVPALAVATRRLHDTNRSGWWQLLNLLPFVGVVVLIVFYIQEAVEPNYYGESADDVLELL